MRLIEEFLHDLRYGRRLLMRNPLVTLIATVTLALGIGANTAIFSVVNAFLLRPLPYGDPSRLVVVDSQYRGQSTGVSFSDYEDWRRQNNVFEDLAFFNLRWNANLDFGNETETLNLTFGTANLFSILQMAPILGHAPTAQEPNTAYFVTQRTREIGIRIALGAQWSDVLKMLLRNGMSLVIVGLTIGLAGAFALTRLMTTLLFEVSPADPFTLPHCDTSNAGAPQLWVPQKT